MTKDIWAVTLIHENFWEHNIIYVNDKPKVAVERQILSSFTTFPLWIYYAARDLELYILLSGTVDTLIEIFRR